MLHHVQRINDGRGLYVATVDRLHSVPVHAAVPVAALALLGGAFGVSYTLGRAVSACSLIGIAVITTARSRARATSTRALAPAVGGIVLALGLFAAAYPFMEGWYDLVRADTLFLFMITGGIAGLPRWATAGKWATRSRARGRRCGGARARVLLQADRHHLRRVRRAGRSRRHWRRVPMYVADGGR